MGFFGWPKSPSPPPFKRTKGGGGFVVKKGEGGIVEEGRGRGLLQKGREEDC